MNVQDLTSVTLFAALKHLRAFVIFVFLAATILISGCESPEERVSGHLAKGEAFLEEDNFLKAELEAKNALQIQPKSSEARYFLDSVAESRGDYPEMAANLRAAIEGRPDFVEARVKLGSLYAVSGALDLAEDQLDEARVHSPDDPGVRILGARLRAANGDLEGAGAELSAVLAQDPANQQALGLLANVTATSDLPAALKLVDQGIAVSEDARPLRLLKIQLLQKGGDIDAVEAELASMVVDYPDEAAFSYQLARLYAATGRPELIEGVLSDLIAKQPENESAKLALVQYMSSTKGIEAGEALLLEFLEKNPDDHGLRLLLGQMYQQMEKQDEALREYETVVSRAGNEDSSLTAKARIAAIKLSSGDTEEGEKLIEEVLALDAANSEALLLRGALNYDRDKMKDAVSDLRTLLRKEPENQRAQMFLARSHTKAKDYLLARDAYGRALEINPANATATLELARIMVNDKDLYDAERLLNKQLTVTPYDVGSTRALIAVLLANKRYDDALDKAKILAEQPDKQALGDFLLGGIYQQREQNENAVAAFKRSLDSSPLAREPLQGLISTLVRMQSSDEARVYLEGLIAEYPENLYAKTLLGQVVAGSGDIAEAQKIFESTLAENDAWLPAYTALAGMKGSDTQGQIDIYRRGLEAVPGSQELALLLGTAYERDGKIEEAIAAYENALKVDPDLMAVANNLAALLADHRSDRASLDRALAVSSRFEDSNNPAFLDTLGWVYYRLGDYKKAEPLLVKSVEGAGQVSVLQYHLGMNYFALGQNKLSATHLGIAAAPEVENYPGLDEARATLKKVTAAP